MNFFGLHIPGTASGAPRKNPVPQKQNPSPYLTQYGNPTSHSNSARYDPYSGSYEPNYINPSYGNFQTYSQIPQIDANGNPIGSGGGGSGGTGQPDTTDLQNSVRNRIASIQNAYGALQGAISPVIQDKVNQYLQSYNQQQSDLNKAYGTTVGQTQSMFGARGLGDSSFQGNALDDDTSTYNTNLNALNQDKSQKLGAIGQYAQGLSSQAKSASDQYGSYLGNLGQYDASQLSSLDSQLAGALPGIQQQTAGMGTNQQFLDTLNQYAPAANQGASQLTAKLQQLASSQAPLFAKNQIAQGLVKSSQLSDPNAQSYYADYFTKLLNGQA